MKRSVLKTTHILTPFNVKIASNYAFLFQDKENKILLGPPPKKAQGYKRTIAMNTCNVLVASWVWHSACIHSYTHKCLSIERFRFSLLGIPLSRDVQF